MNDPDRVAPVSGSHPPFKSPKKTPGHARLTGFLDINVLLSFVLGTVLLGIMLAFSVGFPNPTPFQLSVFMTTLSIAAAGVGAVIPGFLDVRWKKTVRASGAIGLFAIVWFSQPAIEKNVVTLEMPTVSADPVVNSFLADLDRGDVAATYRDLDPVSRERIVPTLDLWRQLYDANMKELGDLESRKLIGMDTATSPPGQPIGVYRYYSYIARYKGLPGARQELVTVRATQDKQWRLFGFLIGACPSL